MSKYFREFLVYALKRSDGRPFYIGKGSRSRYRHHIRHAQSGAASLKCKIIRRMLAGGEQVGYEVIRRCETEAEAFQLEKELIAFYGRLDLGTGILANHTSGGEGVSGHSDELRARISESTRAGMTADVRIRLSAGTKAQMSDPELKAKFVASAKRAQSDPRVVAANSARGREQASRPGFRKRMSEVSKAYNGTPEARAAKRVSVATMWLDPACRAKMLAAQAAGRAAKKARLANGDG